MDSWNRLLKIAQQKVDVKRLKLAELQNRADEMQDKIDRLTVEMELEKVKVDNSSIGSMTLNHYLEASAKKIYFLKVEIEALQPEIEEARKELQEEYKEMKVIEITLAQKIKEMKEIEAKREQQRLDEMASRAKAR